MSAKKPSDMLEFLRREPETAEAPAEHPSEPSVPMVVLRRSQVTVAAIAAGLGLILAFVLGLALGGGGEEAAPAGEAAGGAGTVWVIRVASYKDTDDGRAIARSVAQQLESLDEVTMQTIRSSGSVVVTLGSWIQNPKHNEAAQTLLRRIQEMRDRSGTQHFQSAMFWSIQR